MENPYQAPASFLPPTHSSSSTAHRRGGLGRGWYVLVLMALWIGQNVFLGPLRNLAVDLSGQDAPVTLSFLILVCGWIAALTALSYFRLKNIGMWPWFCLMMFVPCLNLVLLTACVGAPADYENTQQMDLVGLLLVVLLVLLFFLGSSFP